MSQIVCWQEARVPGIFSHFPRERRKKGKQRKSVFIAVTSTSYCHNVHDYISHSNLYKRPIKSIKWSSSRSFLNCFSVVVIITFLFLLFNYSASDFSFRFFPRFHYVHQKEKTLKMASRSGWASARRREKKRLALQAQWRLVAYRSGGNRAIYTESLPLKCFYSAIKLLDNCINAGQCLIKQFDCLFRAECSSSSFLHRFLDFLPVLFALNFIGDFSSPYPTISVNFGKYLHATEGPPPINIEKRAFLCFPRRRRRNFWPKTGP